MYTISCTYVCVYDIQYTIYITITINILYTCMYIVIDNICILYKYIKIYIIYILILCNNVCNIIGGYNIYIYIIWENINQENDRVCIHMYT